MNLISWHRSTYDISWTMFCALQRRHSWYPLTPNCPSKGSGATSLVITVPQAQCSCVRQEQAKWCACFPFSKFVLDNNIRIAFSTLCTHVLLWIHRNGSGWLSDKLKILQCLESSQRQVSKSFSVWTSVKRKWTLQRAAEWQRRPCQQ